MSRFGLLLLVAACGKAATPPAPAVKIDAAPPAKPAPDVKAYVKAVGDLHACGLDQACVDGAIARWPATPSGSCSATTRPRPSERRGAGR